LINPREKEVSTSSRKNNKKTCNRIPLVTKQRKEERVDFEGKLKPQKPRKISVGYERGLPRKP